MNIDALNKALSENIPSKDNISYIPEQYQENKMEGYLYLQVRLTFFQKIKFLFKKEMVLEGEMPRSVKDSLKISFN